MQSTTGDGKWAGICHAGGSRGLVCISHCDGFLVIMPLSIMPLCLFIHLEGMCHKQLSLGTGLGVAPVEMPPVEWCKEGGC